MASKQSNGAANGYTITALSRWSILNKQLPPVHKTGAIHIYDFDNTLFQTPLPNPKLWNNATLGHLGSPDIFINGGWWHDSKILAATGEGVEREEPRAWDGWWNEKVVQLAHLSTKQDDALCVLLTGRSEHAFADLIKRIVTSKGLEFDLIGLKPAVGPNNERFKSTMHFKQVFIESLMETYTEAKEIRIYEDRPRHVAGFRNFLSEYNERQQGLRGPPTRGPINHEVIPVADISTTLDPVVEIAEVQHLINSHNALINERPPGGRSERLVIKKSVFFTGYMIQPADTKRLIQLLTSMVPDSADLRFVANTIMITSRPCVKSILDKIGGLNAKMKWEVSGIGSYDNNIWAALVKPVPATAKYHTDSPVPAVVLGLRKGARPADANKINNWQPIPPDKAFVFDTTVGEKVTLRIEPEDLNLNENESDGLFPHRNPKRKFLADEDSRPRQNSGNFGNNNNNNVRGYHTSTYQGRGGGPDNRGRGGFRGGGASSRGHRGGARGGFKGPGRGGKGGHYRSLDDVETRESGPRGFGYNNPPVSYDDGFPAPPQNGGPPSQQPPPPPPSQFGQPFPQQGQWQPPGGGGPPSQARPMGGAGPDLQNFY
ncbi:hypothetical protein F4779DRAFT_628846 [Xylariaceae sp. FL0662B]|nr:hypothetical protein F4779DRAFT_628846 [Xylariaceae sp. FL0662B]